MFLFKRLFPDNICIALIHYLYMISLVYYKSILKLNKKIKQNMFRKQRQFNIITGQTSHNHITQRTRSCASQLENFDKIIPQSLKSTKLGVPKDQKQYQYSYNQPSLPNINKSSLNQNILKKSHSLATQTMMNYVSTPYNIINHTEQIFTAKVASKQTFSHKMPQVYKKSPLTQHLHRARLLAPNYHENYQQRTLKHQFNKNRGFCANICDIQKTYGQSKFFRKLK